MIDPDFANQASEAVDGLESYLRAGGNVAQRVTKLRPILRRIKKILSRSPKALSALDQIQSGQLAVDHRATLESALAQCFADDPKFAESIIRAISELSPAGQGDTIQSISIRDSYVKEVNQTGTVIHRP